MGKLHKVSDYRPLAYKTPNVKLTFELEPDKTIVQSELEVVRTQICKSNEKLIFDCKNLDLGHIKVNGKKLSKDEYDISHDQVTIHVPPSADEFTVEFENYIYPSKVEDYGGIYRSGDKEKTNEIFTSHCEAEEFRAITPYIDRPDNLAIFTTLIIADREKNPVLLSNGNEIEIGSFDEKRHYAIRYDGIPKPSYLFALVAGQLPAMTDYYITQASHKKVQLNIFSEAKEKVSRTYFGLQILKDALHWDEGRYGIEYDLDNYNIVGVRLFNAGAMENKGLNIFLLESILAENGINTDKTFEWVTKVIAHEFAHNKAGNIVTLEKWPDLSLKEGLATTLECEYVAKVRGAVLPRIEDVKGLRSRQFTEDASPNAHAVRPEVYESIDNFYTTTIYKKGAEILNMLRLMLGDELWVEGLRTYFTQYKGQAASIEKFLNVMSEVSERDLTRFFRWYTQAGTPIIDFEEHYDEKNKTYTITFSQRTNPTPGQDIKLPLHIPIQMGLLDSLGNDMTLQLEAGGSELGTSTLLEMTQVTQSFTFVGVKEKPIPSLFRHFSAPIKMGDTPIDEARLVHLMRYDSDDFNRWDCAQQLMERQLNKIMNMARLGDMADVEASFMEICRTILVDESLSPGLRANMLSMPDASYMLNQMDVADPDLLKQSMDILSKGLAKSLEPELRMTYATLSEQGNDKYTPSNAEMRCLKNHCLQQLMKLNADGLQPDLVKMARKQYSESQSMTDIMAAFKSIYCSQNLSSKKLEASLMRKYGDESSVMSEFLHCVALRDSKDCIQVIQQTMQNEKLFSLSDPENVRSLLRVFATYNLHVHDLSGAGYQLLADAALEIDSKNSSTSTMLIKPLTEFLVKADPTRFKLLESQLRRVYAQPELSTQMKELVGKALEYADKKKVKLEGGYEKTSQPTIIMSQSADQESYHSLVQSQAQSQVELQPRRSERLAKKRLDKA